MISSRIGICDFGWKARDFSLRGVDGKSYSLADVRGKLPLDLTLDGRPFRIVELDGELLAHSTVCPHWLGPLEAGKREGSVVACPWHDYRFDLRTGRSCDGRGLRLGPAPRVWTGSDGQVLVAWD